MILTITPNPSLDISYALEDFALDEVNRVKKVSKTAGGKGLNVARVARLLGAEVVATGFLGGQLGEWMVEDLERSGVRPLFAKTAGDVRNCISILHRGKQTEILEEGPLLSAKDEEAFFDLLRGMQEKPNLVTISGSLPRGLGIDFYAKVVRFFDERGIRVVADTSGATFAEMMESDLLPYAIKPNEKELEDFLGRKYELKELPQLMEKSPFGKIPLLLVSLGDRGALARREGRWYRIEIPTITPVNPVGSGDATVAGLAFALERRLETEEVFKTAMACGVLNALEQATGMIDKTKFDDVYRKIIVERMEIR
ncbi:MAG: hexose kinase [Filifactor alocis]|nr:hexose kinase [Filifactor alocis]